MAGVDHCIVGQFGLDMEVDKVVAPDLPPLIGTLLPQSIYRREYAMKLYARQNAYYFGIYAHRRRAQLGETT